MILALDLGSLTGYAYETKGDIVSGVINFKKKNKFHDSGFKKLYDFLRSFLEGPHEHPNFEIVVEVPHAGRFLAPVRILFGLLAIVHLFCDLFKIKLTWYRAKEIKKFWTGKGSASKEAMVEETQKRFPNVVDNNESDALALLHLHTGAK